MKGLSGQYLPHLGPGKVAPFLTVPNQGPEATAVIHFTLKLTKVLMHLPEPGLENPGAQCIFLKSSYDPIMGQSKPFNGFSHPPKKTQALHSLAPSNFLNHFSPCMPVIIKPNHTHTKNTIRKEKVESPPDKYPAALSAFGHISLSAPNYFLFLLFPHLTIFMVHSLIV